jgi:hypothetical protein
MGMEDAGGREGREGAEVGEGREAAAGLRGGRSRAGERRSPRRAERTMEREKVRLAGWGWEDKKSKKSDVWVKGLLVGMEYGI